MKKVLILFAHPAFHKSRINKQLLEAVSNVEGVTINNLYDNYPDFFIDVKREQQLLLDHDVIVWHHPFYWYSAPAIIKEWMDLVLEHGFAYGKSGRALEGKLVLTTISTGGKREVYCKEGKNHFSINQFLVPFKQSVELCGMKYLPPFVVYGSHTITENEIERHARMYHDLIVALQDKTMDLNKLFLKEYSNDLYSQHA